MKNKDILAKNFDPSVNLKDDFYGFANGGWIAAHPLKANRSRFGVFDFIADKARRQLKSLITTLGRNPKAAVEGTVAQKVNDIYCQVLDIERLNREGVGPIRHLIERIENADLSDFTGTVAWLHHGLSDAFFGAGVTIDPKDSNAHIFGIF